MAPVLAPNQHGDDSIETIELAALERPPPITIAIPINEETTSKSIVDQVPSDPAPRRSNFRLFTVMTALFATIFINALNTTIVATAIPTICSDLKSGAGYSWIGAAYVIATTAVIPIWAKISDIWGRKVILLIGVALYSAASILCAVSTTMIMLIVSRALQGVAGGCVSTLANIIVSDLFSMRNRAFFLGLLHVTWAVAGGVGPVLGGAFTEYLSWRWIFWINLPVCGVAFLLLCIFLDVHNPKTKFADGIKAVDWTGCLSMVAIMVMVLLGLNFGGTAYPWGSPKVICLVVVGSAMIVLFFYNEGRLARHPIMPLGLFRHKSNAACLVVGFTHMFAVNAADYYLPLYFQSAQSSSPLHSGILMLPLVITEALVGILSGIITQRTGRYLELIYLGMALLTLGNGLYISLSATSPLGSIIAFELVAGIGGGLVFDPPLIALQALTSQDDVATSTATLGLLRSLGTSLSIVSGGIIFQNSITLQKPSLRDHGLSAGLLERLAGAEAATNIELISTIADEKIRLAVKQAFAASLANFWIMCTCMAAVGLVAGAVIKRRELGREHTETRTGLRDEKKDEKKKRDGTTGGMVRQGGIQLLGTGREGQRETWK